MTSTAFVIDLISGAVSKSVYGRISQKVISEMEWQVRGVLS